MGEVSAMFHGSVALKVCCPVKRNFQGYELSRSCVSVVLQEPFLRADALKNDKVVHPCC